MNTKWRTLRFMPGLLLAAVAFACLFSIYLPPSASLLAPTVTPTSSATYTPAPTYTSAPTDTASPAPRTTPDVPFTQFRTQHYVRANWERAAGGPFIPEDFENDPGSSGKLTLPYLTGNKLMLSGKSQVEIMQAPQLLQTGNLLHFRDGDQGLTITFAGNTAVRAFGFDYTAPEEWVLIVIPESFEITLPRGNHKFVGILLNHDFPTSFTLRSSANARDGLSIDNLLYVPYIP